MDYDSDVVEVMVHLNPWDAVERHSH
jgi:hypothetical protein